MFEISEENYHWLGADHAQMFQLSGNLSYKDFSQVTYTVFCFIFISHFFDNSACSKKIVRRNSIRSQDTTFYVSPSPFCQDTMRRVIL